MIAVGAGVTRVKVGDKVASCFFQRWPGGEPSQSVQASALGGARRMRAPKVALSALEEMRTGG